MDRPRRLNGKRKRWRKRRDALCQRMTNGKLSAICFSLRLNYTLSSRLALLPRGLACFEESGKVIRRRAAPPRTYDGGCYFASLFKFFAYCSRHKCHVRRQWVVRRLIGKQENTNQRSWKRDTYN